MATTSTIFAPTFLIYCGLRFFSASGLAGIFLTSTTLCESLALPAPCHGGEGSMGPKAAMRGLTRMRPRHLSVVEWAVTHRQAVTLTVLGCSYRTGRVAPGGLAFTLRDWRALHLATSAPFFAIFLISW